MQSNKALKAEEIIKKVFFNYLKRKNYFICRAIS
jgi:hypothetical protein